MKRLLAGAGLAFLANAALAQLSGTPQTAATTTLLNAQWTIGRVVMLDAAGRLLPLPWAVDHSVGLPLQAGSSLACPVVTKVTANVTASGQSSILALNGSASCEAFERDAQTAQLVRRPVDAPLPVVGTIVITPSQYVMGINVGMGTLRCSLNRSTGSTRLYPDTNAIYDQTARATGDYWCRYHDGTSITNAPLYLRFDGFAN